MTSIYPPATPEIAHRRRDLAPNQQAALEALGKAVFADGALPIKTKQIIAVAVAHGNAVSILHRRPHQGGAARGSSARGTDGSDLGRGRDASRRCLCSFNADAR
jgi:hypothetical protein